MAKAQVAAAPARFMTEVAPAPVVSVIRLRKVPLSLDTIAEDDRELLLASPSDYGFAAAWSFKRMPMTPLPQRAGGFMTRDLGKYSSDAHGCRPPVHAQELPKVVA